MTLLEAKSFSFIAPLYVRIPILDVGGPMNRKVFVEHYDICLEGLNPKCIRIPRKIIVEEVHMYFGPMHNKNGYNYVFSEDLKVIAKVEGLWMVIHQKPHVPSSRIISLGMARNIVMELKRKKMNQAMYAKWTNQEQQWCKNSIVELLNDEEEDNEHGEDEILGRSGSCVNIASEEMMQYVEFIEKLLLKVEEQECINMQIK